MNTRVSAESPNDELEQRYQDAWAQRERAERLFQGDDWTEDDDDDDLDD
jgi:hypothetical protein